MSTAMLTKLKEHLETPEGKASFEEYFSKLANRQIITENRFKRFEEYLEKCDFDKFMYRLILEHGDEWREKCWENGVEVHMNNKLSFLFDYVTNNCEPVNVPQIKSDFPNQIWLFKGYYFQITYGQGSIVDIYNADDKRHLLSA